MPLPRPHRPASGSRRSGQRAHRPTRCHQHVRSVIAHRRRISLACLSSGESPAACVSIVWNIHLPGHARFVPSQSIRTCRQPASGAPPAGLKFTLCGLLRSVNRPPLQPRYPCGKFQRPVRRPRDREVQLGRYPCRRSGVSWTNRRADRRRARHFQYGPQRMRDSVEDKPARRPAIRPSCAQRVPAATRITPIFICFTWLISGDLPARAAEIEAGVGPAVGGGAVAAAGSRPPRRWPPPPRPRLR
jgi:hypothetical protein